MPTGYGQTSPKESPDMNATPQVRAPVVWLLRVEEAEKWQDVDLCAAGNVAGIL